MVPCFDLLAGSSLVADWMRQGAYLLTPGWLDRWPEYIAEWGFDRTTARAFFEESVSKLVLLDTGTSSDSSARLEDFAHFIDRPWEVVPVGLDHLRLYLEQRLGARRVQQQQAVTLAELADTRRRLADYAMSYDLISRLATAKAEDLAIDGILESFEMISGPSALTYLPVKDGTVGEPRCVPIAPGADTRGLIGFADGDEPYARTESGDGLVLRIGEPGDTLGVLEFEHVALPRYLEHYLSLGLHLAPVCALAIRNARVFQELQATVSQLQEALANVKTLTGLIPICASCKKIRDDEGYWTQVEVYVASRSSADFTHGICPDCAERSLRGLERYLADRPGLPG